jgi:ATP-dependent Clp protease adaptor protein ClpS
MTAPDVEEITVPDTVEELLGAEDVRPEVPWIVIVWNDPVNTFAYVIFVFQKLFGYSREKASRLTNQVHYEGKAVVSAGTREKCETDVARLHAHGLWATMQKDD